MVEESQFNSDTHVLGEDGKVYEKQLVTATGVAAGLNTGQPKTALAEALEKAMTEAVIEAQGDGITEPNVVRERILAARDKVIEEGSGT